MEEGGFGTPLFTLAGLGSGQRANLWISSGLDNVQHDRLGHETMILFNRLSDSSVSRYKH